MFKKKLILKRILTVSMAASLLVPSSVYATESAELNEAAAVAIDVSKIVKDYEGNYWFPVEDGYARCDEQGVLLEGYEVVKEIPTDPESPQEPEQPETPQEPETPEQPETPQEPETPEQPETPQEPETPEQPETPQEPETPEQPETPQEPETPEQPKTPQESETPEQPETPAQPETTEQSEAAESGIHTNEELIAQQQIVIPPDIEDNYRFTKVAKKYAIAKDETITIYEEKDEEARAVGTLQAGGLCYILADEDQEWIFVESGVVRGFVKSEQLLTGEEAEEIVEETQEVHMYYAEALISPFENEALTYTLTTVRDTVIEKVYAIANGSTVNIREDATKDARIVGMLPKGALCYIIADADQEWVYVESEDVRGFVKAEYLIQGEEADAIVEEKGEEKLASAKEIVAPQKNKAFYYTITSTKEASRDDAVREAMLTYAQQFVGNPYVWGGTSLTNGADCSGFVQGIYKAFGYSIPRVSRDQAVYGMQIPVEEAKPGDLIFYAKNGVVYHVVMYAGDGKTIEAQSTRTGIVNGRVQYSHAVWATRVINAEDAVYEQTEEAAEPYTEYTPAEFEQVGEKLGKYEITTYCDCSLCCGQWSGETTDLNTMPVEGRTVSAADIPVGTRILINGNIYVVEDDNAEPGQIKVYVNEHGTCGNFERDSYYAFSVNE